jgi:hypothetical protein
MKTLLIRGEGEPPAKVRDIVRAGSTEVRETDELKAAAASDADKVVIWRGGEMEVCGPGDAGTAAADHLKWPEDEDKLRMYFETGG